MKTILTSGKRKRSIARVTLRDGKGRVRINRFLLDAYEPMMYRLKIQEPLILAGDVSSKVDIDVNVNGGGMSSQADASRLGIAKALVQYAKGEKLRETFLNYDRTLLVADVRRKEVCKPNDSKARAKRQKSYR
ncbi:MAG TPA: 30S ribosomal protein S9 [Candidatus Nanoarchaeia archaeon]|nr:30S ribosomal protein S9 [Candidatus Nanoarchaeia archaeon]